MDSDTVEQINKIITKIPDYVINHTLEIINQMDPDNDALYRRRLINHIWSSLFKQNYKATCSASYEYDSWHEFAVYLDGWAWKINYEDGNIDCGAFHTQSLQ